MKKFFGVFFHLAPGIAAITGFSFGKPLFTAHEEQNVLRSPKYPSRLRRLMSMPSTKATASAVLTSQSALPLQWAANLRRTDLSDCSVLGESPSASLSCRHMATASLISTAGGRSLLRNFSWVWTASQRW